MTLIWAKKLVSVDRTYSVNLCRDMAELAELGSIFAGLSKYG